MTALCEAVLMPKATLDALEADVTTALDGWTHTAGELGNLRDRLKELEEHDRFATLCWSVTLQLLATQRVQDAMTDFERAKYEEIQEAYAEESVNHETER